LENNSGGYQYEPERLDHFDTERPTGFNVQNNDRYRFGGNDAGFVQVRPQIPRKESNNANQFYNDHCEDTHVRVRPFVSKETDWYSYRNYFESIANLAGWSERTRCMRLLSALQGNLTGVSTGMNSNLGYHSLLSRLDSIHGCCSDKEDALNKLDYCRKKEEESMAMFAERVRQLVERAYPNFTAPDKEQQNLRVFLQGLPLRGDLRLKMRSAMFASLSEAIRYGTNLEQILKEEKQAEKAGRFSMGRGVNENEQEAEPLVKALNAMNHKFASLERTMKETVEGNRQMNDPPGGRDLRYGGSRNGNTRGQPESYKRYTPENSPCMICGELGHWRRDCPRQNKNPDNQRSDRPRDQVNLN
jgi:hypothetical protein